MWNEVQSNFSEALDHSDMTPPVCGFGFDVYRNNVAVSLAEALGETYRVVKALVGEEFFHAMALQYRLAFPPISPVLAEWGAEFEGFIRGFEPVQSLPYLADIACLEWAWLQAYHAQDAHPCDIGLLSGLRDGDLEKTCLLLHPTLTLVASEWPIVSIWAAHQNTALDQGLRNLPEQAETALVIRPDLTVHVSVPTPGEVALIKALMLRESLGDALEKGDKDNGSKDRGTDTARALASLFQRGAVIGIETTDMSREDI